MYRVREVDGYEEGDTLADLHLRTFDKDNTAPMADFDDGYWWIAFHKKEPVAFAGISESFAATDIGYFSRVGVLPDHRGHNLQLRLMRCLEAKARRVGFRHIVTDTHNAPYSANNIIARGFRMFDPAEPWSPLDATIYWKKDLR